MSKQSFTAQIKKIKARENVANIVTPRLEQWLIDHPEGLLLEPEDMRVLRKLTMTAPRDRRRTWGASSRGNCPRAQSFQLIGMPATKSVDPVLQLKFMDGTWRHIRWQLMLLKAGILTRVEVPIKSDRYNIRGTLDGIGLDEEGEEFGFELKGWSRMPEEPVSYHLDQVGTYFLARPKLKRFVLMYEHKSSQEWKEFVIERSPELLESARKELEFLEKSRKLKKLPAPLQECSMRKGAYNQCPYRLSCLAVMSWEEAEEVASAE